MKPILELHRQTTTSTKISQGEPPTNLSCDDLPADSRRKDIAGDIKEFSSFFSEIMEKFKDFEAGFKALVDEHDMVSTRQYLWNALVAHTTTRYV